MAKQEPVDKTSKSKSRKVKNPESFRERAIKASENETKTSRSGAASKPIKQFFGAITKPFRVASEKTGKTRIGKILKKPLHVIAVILLIPYFKSSFAELKQVTWPSLRQSRKLTFAVLAFAVAFGAFIAGLDWILGKLAKDILIK